MFLKLKQELQVQELMWSENSVGIKIQRSQQGQVSSIKSLLRPPSKLLQPSLIRKGQNILHLLEKIFSVTPILYKSLWLFPKHYFPAPGKYEGKMRGARQQKS